MATKQAKNSNALTLKGKDRLVDYLSKHREAIQAVMPQQMDERRIVMALENAIRRNYQIAGCTTLSVFNALATCYRDGLEIAPNEAYLVPFRQGNQNICTLVYDYRGLIKIAYKAGVIQYMRPFLVRENDAYEFDGGGGIVHQPRAPESKKAIVDDVIFGYCRTRLSSGADLPIDPVWRVELDKIFENATARLKREDGPWYAWKERMWLKSVVKREFHSIPRDDRALTGAIETDNAFETGDPLPRVIDVEMDSHGEDPIDPEYVEPDEDEEPKRK